eukprot:CAMPEP_0179424772 /NCGR_PEP_ID=MMETSP0799-20121207/11789_1 /TAXON_ID=46947 /ORGANISM="Geminigera cryophila, Strain CCMP2564" /LENGTH=140 /DNA_ID=CAMNT_0021199291 /DNA_START=67 /DNA_END=490 /DNA_ORIENTATION=-
MAPPRRAIFVKLEENVAHFRALLHRVCHRSELDKRDLAVTVFVQGLDQFARLLKRDFDARFLEQHLYLFRIYEPASIFVCGIEKLLHRINTKLVELLCHFELQELRLAGKVSRAECALPDACMGDFCGAAQHQQNLVLIC